MADIATTIDRDRDLTVRTVTGEVTAQERLTASEVKMLAQSTVPCAHLRAGGQTALAWLEGE